MNGAFGKGGVASRVVAASARFCLSEGIVDARRLTGVVGRGKGLNITIECGQFFRQWPAAAAFHGEQGQAECLDWALVFASSLGN